MTLIWCMGGGLALSLLALGVTVKLIGWNMGDYPTYDFRLHEDDKQ